MLQYKVVKLHKHCDKKHEPVHETGFYIRMYLENTSEEHICLRRVSTNVLNRVVSKSLGYGAVSFTRMINPDEFHRYSSPEGTPETDHTTVLLITPNYRYFHTLGPFGTDIALGRGAPGRKLPSDNDQETLASDMDICLPLWASEIEACRYPVAEPGINCTWWLRHMAGAQK